MKSKNLPFKIFALSTVLAVTGIGLAGYGWNKAVQKDPTLMTTIQDRLNGHYGQNFFQFSFDSNQTSGETSSTTTQSFPATSQEIKIMTVTADVNFLKSDDSDIKIRMTFDGGPNVDRFIKTTTNDNIVELKQIGKARSAKIDVYLPQTFRENVTVKTVSGNVNLAFEGLKEIEIKTVSGEAQMQGDMFSKLSAETVSGNVQLDLHGSQDNFDIEIKSLSGKISNSKVSADGAAKTIHIKTISGNIEVK